MAERRSWQEPRPETWWQPAPDIDWFTSQSKISVAHTWHCGRRVEQDSSHGLSCTKCAGRFSRHYTINPFIKQTLRSLDLPSMLELCGQYWTDGKRPDGVTKIPWEMGKELVRDVTFVDALARPNARIKVLHASRDPPPARLKRGRFGSIAK